MRRLFEGGVTNAKTLAAGGDYSRAATIGGRRLIDEIRYLASFISVIILSPIWSPIIGSVWFY